MNNKKKRAIVVVKDKEQLRKVVEEEIGRNGNECDLNHIDTSQVENLSYLFCNSSFNGDISEWDVSNVTNMKELFAGSKFNGDLSKWDVSNVTNMMYLFYEGCYERNLSGWDVSSVKYIHGAFMRNSGDTPWWYIDNMEKRREEIKKRQMILNFKKKIEGDIENEGESKVDLKKATYKI